MPGLMKQKPRGLFGSVVSSVPAAPAMTATEQPLAPKRNFFGEGGTGRGIAGNIGDFLLQYAGAQPIYQPAMQQQQQQRHQTQQRQLQRAEGLEDWQAKQEWERDNPKPKDPTQFEQILDAAGYQGDERTGLLRQKAQNDAAGAPIAIDVSNADGSVSRQYVRPGQIGVPNKPVGKLTPIGGAAAPTSAGGMTPPSPANVMGRHEYQMFVRSMGQEAADRYIASQGITVGNY